MIETRVDGDPAALREASRYLLLDLGRGAVDLADRVAAERSLALGAWDGEAGRAFAEEAARLARAGDGVADTVRTLGWRLEELADELEALREGMAQLRDVARAAGLRVVGTVVAAPAVALPAGASASEDEQDLFGAYADLRRRADELRGRWTGHLAATAGSVETQRLAAAQLLAGMLSDGYSAFLSSTLTPTLRGQAAFLAGQAQEAAVEAAALRGRAALGQVTPASVADDVATLERRAAAAADEAATYTATAERHALASTALKALGPALAVYGVHVDMESGEPAPQAVLSQAAGLAAGAQCAAVGGTLGSAAPGLGTVVGAVVGGATCSVGAGWLVDRGVERFYDAREEQAAAAAAREAEEQRRRDEQRVRNLIAVAEGRPPWSGPWTTVVAPDERPAEQVLIGGGDHRRD